MGGQADSVAAVLDSMPDGVVIADGPTAEVLSGGSMFWIIKGSIRARQKILGLEPVIDSEGRKACAIRFDPELVETEALPYKPIQGWRYLTVEEAPIDRPSDADSSDMPAAMRAELRALGLL